MAEWRNWSGSVVAAPAEIERPRTEAELRALVARRAAGARGRDRPLVHAAVRDRRPAAALADMEGDLEIAAGSPESAWVPAGWPIARLDRRALGRGPVAGQPGRHRQAGHRRRARHRHPRHRPHPGLALHARPGLSSWCWPTVRSSSATPSANRTCSRRSGVSLGMLGVMSRVRLAVVPGLSPARDHPPRAAGRDPRRLGRARRAPSPRGVLRLPLRRSGHAEDPRAGGRDAATIPCARRHRRRRPSSSLCDVASAGPGLAPAPAAADDPGHRARRAAPRPACRIFPSERDTRFEEMEYEIPAAAGADALAPGHRRGAAPPAADHLSASSSAPWPATTSGSRR